MSTKRENVFRKVAALATLGSMVALSACAGAAGGDVGGGETLEDMTPMQLKVGTLYGPDNWFTWPMEDFTDRIEERTDGKVSFEYYYAGSLVPTDELPSALDEGVIDFAWFAPSYKQSRYPIDDWVSTLSSTSSATPIAGTLQAAAASLEWSTAEDAFVEQFLDNNVMPLMPQLVLGAKTGLLCKEDNSTLEALQGMRVRVLSESTADELRALGMVPVSLPLTEVYQAFQQGVIDCTYVAPHDAVNSGFYDVAKHHNLMGLNGVTSATYGFNLDTWNRFPEEVQQIIFEEAGKYRQDLMTSYMQNTIDAVKDAEGQGVTFHVPDDATNEALDAKHQDFLAEAAAEAPDALGDPQAATERYQAISDKWFEKISEELDYDATTESWADFVADGGEIPDLSAWGEALDAQMSGYTEHMSSGQLTE